MKTKLALLVAVGMIVGLSALPAAGHVGGTIGHLWFGVNHIRDRVNAFLSTPDAPINEASDPVHWTRLNGVPNGIADGKDHGLKLCERGTLRAAIRVTPLANGEFPGTFVNIAERPDLIASTYNACHPVPDDDNSTKVWVRKLGTGIYMVRFDGTAGFEGKLDIPGFAVGTGSDTGSPTDEDNFLNVVQVSGNDYRVTVWDNDDSSREDDSFTLTLF